ncbi:MAG: DUF998 domain-containing protein [Pseudonocardia sp.]
MTRSAVVSSAAAPVLLIVGWTVAAAHQRGGFDPAVQTISALAALDADQRWIMTAALAGVGLCHLTSAIGLRMAAPAGRAVLAAGGVATVLVATFPLPADHGSAPAHAVVAGAAFGALAAWPALSWRQEAPTRALRLPAALAAATGLLGLVGWFAAELSGGDRVGLAERVAAGAQALWPLVVVLSGRRRFSSAAGSGRAGSRTGP